MNNHVTGFSIRDIILTVRSVAFGYALVPQVFHGFRERVGGVTIQTSVVTGGALFAVTGSLWVVLLAQRLAYGPVRRDKEDARRD